MKPMLAAFIAASVLAAPAAAQGVAAQALSDEGLEHCVASILVPHTGLVRSQVLNLMKVESHDYTDAQGQYVVDMHIFSRINDGSGVVLHATSDIEQQSLFIFDSQGSIYSALYPEMTRQTRSVFDAMRACVAGYYHGLNPSVG